MGSPLGYHGLRRRSASVSSRASTVTTMKTVEIALSDGIEALLHAPEDLERQRARARARGEVGDDQLVERERERHQPARDDRRHQVGHQHLGEGLQRRRAEVERRLLEGGIEAREARLHGGHHEREAEGDVRDHDRRVAELQADRHEQDQQAHAEDHFRHDHRQERQRLEQVRRAVAVAVEQPGAGGAEHQRDQRGRRRDDQAVLQRAHQHRVAPERGVPVEREAGPDDVELRLVEREQHEHGDRQIEEEQDESRPDREQPRDELHRRARRRRGA